MEIFGLLMGLLLLLHRSAQTKPGIDHEFVHVEANLSWEVAQTYCRLHYQDLFTVWHENDLKNLTGSAKNLSWIGLYKGDQLWKWVDESNSEYFNWHELGQCASITKKGFWYSRSCDSNLLAFVCKQFPRWDLNTFVSSWSEANNNCEKSNKKLAILHNAEENGNVTAVLGENEAWIGLTKNTENKWKWVDENPLIYSNWFTLFLCAVMDCNGFWHDTSCFEEKPFVCSGNINGNVTYELVGESKIWKEAKSHCKLLNDQMQLATLKTKDDMPPLLDQICQSKDSSFSFWIGLYNDPWRWSSGSSHIKNWNSMQPDEKDFRDESVSHCAANLDGEWFVEDCHKNLSFFCSVTVRSMILVSEPKSWEEALDHCRDKYVDLASLGSDAEQKVAMRKIEDVQSGYVWTGLRFLAGSWFWVYGDGLQYENWLDGEQPQCPDVAHHCGALAVSSGKWELRSCEEKLEFLCFQK